MRIFFPVLFCDFELKNIIHNNSEFGVTHACCVSSLTCCIFILLKLIDAFNCFAQIDLVELTNYYTLDCFEKLLLKISSPTSEEDHADQVCDRGATLCLMLKLIGELGEWSVCVVILKQISITSYPIVKKVLTSKGGYFCQWNWSLSSKTGSTLACQRFSLFFYYIDNWC